MKRPAIQFEDVLSAGATDKRIEVLRAIHHAGSISEAARACGVSYKAAWQAVETLGNLAGVALIDKAVGGSGGGGARLTAEGLQVLRAADVLGRARADALARLNRRGSGSRLQASAMLQVGASVGLRTSMRNQLPCTVRALRKSQGAVRVVLGLGDQQTLAARITAESEQLLGLRVGLPVLALCKATAVTVAPTIVVGEGVNLLHGHVVRRSGASGRVEVSLRLGSADASAPALVGFADTADAPRLRHSAMAAIDESAVVIAIAG